MKYACSLPMGTARAGLRILNSGWCGNGSRSSGFWQFTLCPSDRLTHSDGEHPLHIFPVVALSVLLGNTVRMSEPVETRAVQGSLAVDALGSRRVHGLGLKIAVVVIRSESPEGEGNR